MTEQAEKAPLQARFFTASGKPQSEHYSLPVDFYDGEVNEDVLHQAVKVFLGNQRQGTHKVKTRHEVSGGGRKIYKQKGTGNARQGSIRAPHWRGGGIVFGPTPRDYRTGIPRKVRQLARRSALNARAREGMLVVIEPISLKAPKTSVLLDLLGKIAPAGTRILVLTAAANPTLYLSARNVPYLNVLPYAEASTYDILASQVVVIESTALGEGLTPVSAEDAAADEAPTRKAPRSKKVSE